MRSKCAAELLSPVSHFYDVSSAECVKNAKQYHFLQPNTQHLIELESSEALTIRKRCPIRLVCTYRSALEVLLIQRAAELIGLILLLGAE